MILKVTFTLKMYKRLKAKQLNQVSTITNFGDLKIYPYKNQNYEELKNECLSKGCLFEDPLFPAVDQSIFYTKPLPYGCTWKRPHEIVQSPVFVDDITTAEDLDQGQLGNCWFIAGCAAVALIPELYKKVVPSNQSMEKSDYAGIFHFRFWIYGNYNFSNDFLFVSILCLINTKISMAL